MPADAPLPPVNPMFVIVTFSVSIAIGIAVALLGIYGMIGTPIP
jgi:hypothetical protein